jgi:DegV family protein with EDD domain
MNKVIVTADSTANLPAELIEKYQIPIIPLNIHWEGKSYKEGVTLDTERFYQQLQKGKDFPTTSQPSAGEFVQFFQHVAERYETDTILCIVISSEMSGTLMSATQAKAHLPNLHIEILDSRSVSMGAGFQVLAAVRAAQAGAGLEEVMQRAQQVQTRAEIIFVVDTLEYLHRGGRIGGAARLLGTALNLKPVLAVEDGRVEAIEKVRSRRKSLRRLIEIVEERLNGQRPTEMAVMHVTAEAEMERIAQQVSEQFGPQQLYKNIFTPVVGVHSGPGTVGVLFHTATAEG